MNCCCECHEVRTHKPACICEDDCETQHELLTVSEEIARMLDREILESLLEASKDLKLLKEKDESTN